MGDCGSCNGSCSSSSCGDSDGRETVYSYDLRQEIRNNLKNVDCEYKMDDVVYNPQTYEWLKVRGYKKLQGDLYLYVEILTDGLEETEKHYLVEPCFVKREK